MNVKRLRVNNNSGYNGVQEVRKGIFIAVLCHKKNRMHLGTFNNVIAAAMAYDQAVLSCVGGRVNHLSKLNFPEKKKMN